VCSSDLLLAGICAGFATSSKYNAALIVIPIAVAHFISHRGHREIYLAALASVLAFFAATPFALLDWTRFWQAGILGDAAHYVTGHAGGEGDTLQWYLSFLWESQRWLLALALVGAIWVVATRDRKGIVLLSFPLCYFVFINLYTVRFETTILPVVPFVVILAALFIARLHHLALRHLAIDRGVARAALIGITILLTLPPLRAAATYNIQILQPDTRERARQWLDANLPPGARVAVEPYSPYVERPSFTVEGVGGMTAYLPDWYVQNGFEYLVFSYGTYGRFFENPTRYADFIARYNELFARFPEVKRFSGNGYEIRIHKTNVTALPSERVAARLGIYDGMLELVGYDLQSARVGEPFNLTLHWRALAAHREPLKLTARLLDRADREIAQSGGDLFDGTQPGGRWHAGIVRVAWQVGVPTEPGMYRLELAVDAEGLGRIPVLSYDRRQVSDKLFLGPFKVAPASPVSDELQRARTVSAKFGGAIALLGYSTCSGDPLGITLYWQSAAKMDKDYTVFIHLLDSNGNLRAQVDTQPRGGAYPTSIWDVGEVVRDDYVLTLRDLAPGEYEIELGLYEYPSLARLPVVGADGRGLGDHLILSDGVKVAGP
jgi:hypothetical protein